MFCLHFLPDNLQPTTNPNRGRKRPKQIHQTHPSTAQWPPGGSPRWFQPSVELLVQGSSSSLEMPGHRNNRLLRHVEPPATCKFGREFQPYFWGKSVPHFQKLHGKNKKKRPPSTSKGHETGTALFAGSGHLPLAAAPCKRYPVPQHTTSTSPFEIFN